MKNAFFFLVFWGVLAQSPVIRAQGNTAAPVKAKVTVYYFHPNERCPIDQSIEENTKDLLKKEYANEIKAGTLKLQVLNTDDKANAKLVSQFQINAQALYIVKLDKGKEIKTDLTKFAFEFGLSNPSKFRNGLADEIDKALQ
jgi:hypothetical protein